MSAIISPSTYNGRSDRTPECGDINNQWRSWRRFPSQHSYDYYPSIGANCTYLSYVYTYSSSNLEEVQFDRYSTAVYTYQYPTRAKKPTYGKGSVYEWSTLTAMNVCTSIVHLWRRHPTIEAHREIHLQARPTQFRRPSMMTTMTMKTMKTSQSTIIKGNQSTYYINDFRLQWH